MFKIKPEVYLGKQFANGFTGQFVVSNYFGVLSFEDGISQDEGKRLIEEFKTGLIDSNSYDLKSFEDVVAKLILKLNFPLHADLTIGFICENILYLKTVGRGQIYVLRDGICKLLLKGNKVASGVVKDKDLFILTNHLIENLLGEESDIQAFVYKLSGKEIVQKISAEDYSDEDTGFILFAVEFTKFDLQADEAKITVSNSVDIKTEPILESEKFVSENTSKHIKKFYKDKRFVLSALIVLIIILSWSVVFGYQRRQAMAISKKIELGRGEIVKKLEDAEKISQETPDRAIELIEESKNMLQSLKNEMNQDLSEETFNNIKQDIQEREEKIVKKNNAKYEEFYDFTLEKKDANGNSLGLEGSILAVLDNSLAIVYLLDLENKSLKQYISPELKDATLVTVFRGEVYFFVPSEGIYKFTAQNKVRSIISNDEDWGEVKTLQIYNGNIYLLDSVNRDLYRYLVTEGGYSSKKSYFLSNSELKDEVSIVDMAIDGSVYFALEDGIIKYLSGKKEDFEAKFPSKNLSLSKLTTGQDDKASIYVLDDKSNTVYQFSKSGIYEKSYQSDIFNKDTDIFFYDNRLFALNKSKIFVIE